MKHIVSFGGGVTSFELAVEVARKYGANNVEIVIAALAGESPDLWRVLELAEKETAVKATRLCYNGYTKNGSPGYFINAPPVMWRDIWDIFFEEKIIGNNLFDVCSRILKRDLLKRYITRTYPKGEAVIHVGITADEEQRRLPSIVARWAEFGYEVEADLTSFDFEHNKAARSLDRLGFIPALYLAGFPNHNCGGACVKASPSQWVKLMLYDPETFYYHAAQESRWQATFNLPYTILRRQTYTYEQVEVEGDVEALPLFPSLEASGVKTIKKKKYASEPYALYDLAQDVKRIQLSYFDKEDHFEMIVNELGFSTDIYSCSNCESIA